MLDYIWVDDKSPILKQLPKNFKSAALLLHPFVQMPSGWEGNVRKTPYEHIYPSNEEIFNIGKPISWREIMNLSGLKSYKEIAVALLTSTGALKKEYERADLASKLNSSLNQDLYYPAEDSTSIFLLENLLTVLYSKGAHKLYFSEPTFGNSGSLNLYDTTLIEICNLSGNELIVTDENMDNAFMSLFDSFATLLITNEENIEHTVQLMNCEAVVCTKNTFIDWYF
nr:DUF2711 family protein [Metabacillus sp. cB07]